MKTTVKQIASIAFIALLLFVGNVKADGTEIKATSLKTAETTLQVERWMTSETIWNTNSLNVMDFASETEAALELESWMTNSDAWNLNNNFVVESESGMELEDWMTDNNTWDMESQDVESKLTVEKWMVDSELWK